MSEAIPTYHIVVAKYKEDISWTKQFEPGNLRIYDKSGEATPYIPRENVGRESETYIHYILTHYDCLPEYVFFLQGNPFEHMWASLNVSKWTSETCHEMRQEFEKIILERPENPMPLFSVFWQESINYYPAMNLREYFKTFFDIGPNIVRFSTGCQYVISRERILSRPKAFYEKVAKMLTSGETAFWSGGKTHGPESAPFEPTSMNPWIFERMFYHFFSDFPLSDSFL